MRVLFVLCLALAASTAPTVTPQNSPAQNNQTQPAQSVAVLQAAAQHGDALAQLKLARAYANGAGVAKNDELAFAWCQKAAEQGNADAENLLGLMYRTGTGVGEDKNEAARWYAKAARQGNAGAMFNLGAAYYNGDGVPVDDSVSYAWFVLAKEAGEPHAAEAVARGESQLSSWQLTDSYKQIAVMLEDGKYVPANQSESASWWLRAATNGDAEAQIAIANKFLHGQGVPQDFPRARYWCSEAVKRGDMNGEFCLGYIDQQGLGVAANPKAARSEYERAAQRGNEPSILALAKMDETGEGGKPDIAGAFVLYAELAAANDPDAMRQAIRIRDKLSKKDWGEVQKRLLYYHIDPHRVEALLQQPKQ